MRSIRLERPDDRFGHAVSFRVSVSIANNLLLVGSPFTGSCLFSFACVGRANLYDLNRFDH